MTRKDLPNILLEILNNLGGKASMMQIFRYFWEQYGKNISKDDDIFYTWNYDIRWAATHLRKRGLMKQARNQENSHGKDTSSKGIWELA